MRREMAWANFMKMYYLIITYYYLPLYSNETAYILCGVLYWWRLKYLIYIY
jgi:hypothetical protein